MRTLNRLVVCARPITDTIRSEQEAMARVASIPGVVQIVNEYRHTPDILKHITLEGDRDIDERSVYNYIHEPKYHNVHLVLSYPEWKQLGLRTDLLGQSKEMADGQIITYGRWNKTMPYTKRVARKHPAPLNKLPEASLGAWHELDHGLRNIWGVDPTSTHYHFYGYATEYRDMKKAEQNKIKPRRYVRKPDALEAWRALPWEKLTDRVTKKPTLLETLKAKLEEAVRSLAGKRVEEEREVLALLQPLVRRKAEELLYAMARKGYAVDIVEGYRSIARQNELYAQGRTKPGQIVTNARGGESLHNYGVALDVVFMVGGKPSWANTHPWHVLGETAEELGFTWGGRWTALVDRPHLELTLGYNLADFMNDRVDYTRYT